MKSIYHFTTVLFVIGLGLTLGLVGLPSNALELPANTNASVMNSDSQGNLSSNLSKTEVQVSTSIITSAHQIFLPIIMKSTLVSLPKDILVFYAHPSDINLIYTIDGAATEFGRYDYVILADCLEFDGSMPGGPFCNHKHPDHDNTKAIITHPATANTKFCGYIDLGVSTQNLSMAEIKERVNLWKAMGAAGIFFDDFGYDFLTSRDRQNEAVDYAHSLGLFVVANGFHIDQVLGSEAVSPYNPSGTPPKLGPTDFYFWESFQIKEGEYVSETEWQNKAAKLEPYRQTLGIQVMATTTNNAANIYDQKKFFYAWFSALLYGYQGVGWGEDQYSAMTAQAPFRNRPNVVPGAVYLSDVIKSGSVYYRDTDLGRIWVNTSTHDAGFTPN